MHSTQIFCTLLLALAATASAVNILYIHGVISPSHHIWNRALAKGLASRGYNVTFVSTDPPAGDVPNLHYIELENNKQILEAMALDGHEDLNMVQYYLEFDRNKFRAATAVADYTMKSCKAIVQTSGGLEKILSYPDDFRFDLVINDFTCGPCLLPLVHKFRYPPLVGVSPFLNPPYTNFVVGGHKHPAYVPHYVLNLPNLMTFPQRLFNTVIHNFEQLLFKFQVYPEVERVARDYFKFDDMPSLLEIEQRTKLILLNSDHAIDYPEPLQPNMVLVGGLQISKPKELPADMRKFVEAGERGTVLMSLGTNIMSNLLGDEILTAILQTFESLPAYNFVWKFESEPKDLPVRPSANVMVVKWVPQNDLLGHPNVRAFISHAGGLSTQESLWYGKPMVGIPFMADQHRSINKVVANGLGVKVDIAKLTAESFRTAIVSVLETPSYAENAAKTSRLFRDKPMEPLERALWWIDFVMRNPEAPIYRSPTLDLGFLAANNYDILLIFVVLLHASFFGLRFLLRKLCGGKRKQRSEQGKGKKVKRN